MFFALRPQSAVLSDSVAELVDTFSAVRDRPKKVVEYLSALPPDKDTFYQIRQNRSHGRLKRAAEFIYLNMTCWNGLYRVNSKGDFNVPFGQMKSPRVYSEENIRACANALNGSSVELTHGDFADAISKARAGDFVYLDPPYVTSHNKNGFHEWNSKLFIWSDQVRLSQIANRLADKGVHVLVSNADHFDIIKLYSEFHVTRIERASTLAGDPNKRRRTTELLFSTTRNYQPR